MKFGVREKCLGRGRDVFCRERSGRNERNVAQTLYIEILVSRWMERCQKLSRIKKQEIAIEELSRVVYNKRGSMDREAVKQLSRLNLKNLDGSRLR